MQDKKTKLRSLILEELSEAGWDVNHKIISPPTLFDKEAIRTIHSSQRIERAQNNRWIIDKFGKEYINLFASGKDISPDYFSPKLIQIRSKSWESNLFRFASMLWSIPVSQGYGRRMRYLVIDEYNNKLVGIFAIGDPVFNLKMRDDYISWDSNLRREHLYNVMDAYVLGSVPPYNRLLGGKFVALSILSDQVRDDFKTKYEGTKTVIEEKEKDANLVLITTTSALGKSSIYNRIKLNSEDKKAFFSVGYSGGWGHFHFSNSVFNELREFLRENDESYADGYKFGQGPNWKMRTIRKALELLGFNLNLLRHGIKREIFLAPLAINYKEYLREEEKTPIYFDNRDIQTISAFFKNRWMIPRSKRENINWKDITLENTWRNIMTNGNWSDQFPD